MSESNNSQYKFADLANYSFKDRVFIRLTGLAFYSAIKLIGSLARFSVDGIEHLDAIEQAGRAPIFTSWHDRIFLNTYYWRDRGILVMSSYSKDSEYVARMIQRFGYGTIKGSSSRGGSRALIEMIRSMRLGKPMGFTVDGPRGPRYVAKAGPVVLAKKTGNPILPFLAEARSYWTIGSWDRLHIPKPFTQARVFIAEPIYVDPRADDSEVESKRIELQSALDRLVERGREWSASR